MCINQKLIYPKYSKRPMYVKCGHCPACLQEKAAKRVKRIRDTRKSDLSCFMVTLTYSKGCVPYVLRKEAYDFVNGRLTTLNIYRDCTKRKVRKVLYGNDYAQVYKTDYNTIILDKIELIPFKDFSASLSKTKDLKHEHGKIGICHYKDYQHFIARLRLNLKRHFGYEKELFVYACSEYGCKTQRPHFHLLIFVNHSAKTFLRDAVVESWPFSDLRRFPRSCEESFRSASYVASYVNQSNDFPLFFKVYAKPKHSYSKGFGMANKEYSLDKILEKVRNGYVAYTAGVIQNGIFQSVDVPVPSYVINRYFPKFKTSTRCSPSTLCAYLRRILTYDWDIQRRKVVSGLPFDTSEYVLFHDNLYLNEDELFKISTRLHNSFKRYKSIEMNKDKTIDDYILDYKRTWNAYNSTILRLHMLNPDIPFIEKYDNWDAVMHQHKFNGLNVVGVDNYDNLPIDPNKYKSNIISTGLWTESFHQHIKHRNVSNAIYALSPDCEL